MDKIKALHLKELNDQAVTKLQEMRSAVLGSQKQIQYAAKATRAYIENKY